MKDVIFDLADLLTRKPWTSKMVKLMTAGWCEEAERVRRFVGFRSGDWVSLNEGRAR